MSTTSQLAVRRPPVGDLSVEGDDRSSPRSGSTDAPANPLDLPILTVDLEDFTIRTASASALRLLGRTSNQLVGQSIVDALEEGDASECRAALELLRRGPIDFYRTHRQLSTDGLPANVTLWVQAVEIGGARLGLVQLATGEGPRRSPLAEYFGYEPPEMAVGATDASWVITSISTEIETLLGVPPGDMVGRPLLGAVQQEDVSALVEADVRRGTDHAVGLHVSMRDGSGSWRRMCCILTAVAGGPRRCFILVADPEPTIDNAARVLELEYRLWRIAAHVEASGILQQIGTTPDVTSLPQMESLSARQWEVLSRLMRGERVPTIARALFVSQSTVRNHLSAIFKRFGVHSQAELLAALQRTDGPPA